jgi:imidazolonepropionase-like amidohydrolase
MIHRISPSLTLAGVLLGVLLASSVGAKDEHVPQTLITNVQIFDGVSDKLTPGSVLIEGNLIKQIGESLSAPDAAIIDGGGRTLMPGLIDVHTHVAATANPTEVATWRLGYLYARAVPSAERMLLRGFTAVRDVGVPATDLARAIDEGHIVGPRILSVGAIISTTSGPADYRTATDGAVGFGAKVSNAVGPLGMSFNVDGPDEVRRAVRQNLFNGAIQIKTYVSGGVTSEISPLEATPFAREELVAMVEAAERFDTYVLAHSHTVRATREAVEAGIKCIEHVSALDDETSRLIKKKGFWVVPSIRHVINSQSTPPAFFSKSQAVRYMKMGETAPKAMDMIVKYDLNVGFGTDFPGDAEGQAMQSTEFEARLKWWTPLQILRQATSENAKILGLANSRLPYKDGPLGVIKEGAYADILVVEGNPLEDIKILGEPEKNMKIIMKDGVIYKNTLAK